LKYYKATGGNKAMKKVLAMLLVLPLVLVIGFLGCYDLD